MASIHDVARVAGVSISTVSYALSGKRSIAASTRQRVDEAVRQLGYRPHAGARMLAGARTHILALSAPMRGELHLPTHMRFVTEVLERARESDYDVLLLVTDEASSGIARVSSSSLVDGVVLMGVDDEDDRAALIRAAGVPATFIGVPADAHDLACVDLDFAEAARRSVRLLAEQGHRSIGLIEHPQSYTDRNAGFVRRFDDAFEAECAALGLALSVERPHIGRASASAAVDALLTGPVSALVLHCNEPVAEAAIERLVERGLSIPGDLSVLAACASYDGAALPVPVSSIPLPFDAMCRAAVARTLQQIDSGRTTGVDLLPPHYVDRGSLALAATGAPVPAAP
ncbi:LacI family transcriptional regulator [Rathayibacter sp. PhB93]|uniref:LacI family DNA-binding transcriptional regulator n=1 Tax=unclassified Rathayibacter TaxID=2609250 RepID=UPI000FBA4D5B|nr:MULTISPECIES: LacI family DNA-binding transcriptional regulator [unclassified Rathayibacter]ROQ03297.1 LacI family transcriptional regulator [Rathayibacter sp. PhB93]TDQ09110.1 LacI family transcriptional regulator [Rathayibacter sp. PhB1]